MSPMDSDAIVSKLNLKPWSQMRSVFLAQGITLPVFLLPTERPHIFCSSYAASSWIALSPSILGMTNPENLIRLLKRWQEELIAFPKLERTRAALQVSKLLLHRSENEVRWLLGELMKPPTKKVLSTLRLLWSLKSLMKAGNLGEAWSQGFRAQLVSDPEMSRWLAELHSQVSLDPDPRYFAWRNLHLADPWSSLSWLPGISPALSPIGSETTPTLGGPR
jgi:hypothetical protein